MGGWESKPALEWHMRMNDTTEKMLTWGPLGLGVGLMLADHRRLGMAVAMLSPVTVALEHPKATRKALQAIPENLAEYGKATGKALRKAGEQVGCSAKQTAKGLRWLAG